jgi:hypothetical protein
MAFLKSLSQPYIPVELLPTPDADDSKPTSKARLLTYKLGPLKPASRAFHVKSNSVARTSTIYDYANMVHKLANSVAASGATLGHLQKSDHASYG